MAPVLGSVVEPRTAGRITLRPRVTIEELATALRCHPETVRRYYRAGDIEGARLGGSITFAAEDVAAFLVRNGITNIAMVSE